MQIISSFQTCSPLPIRFRAESSGRKQAFNQILSNIQTKSKSPGKPVKISIPPKDKKIPRSILEVYKTAINKMDIDEFSVAVDNKLLGIAEEAADVIHYILGPLLFSTNGIDLPMLKKIPIQPKYVLPKQSHFANFVQAGKKCVQDAPDLVKILEPLTEHVPAKVLQTYILIQMLHRRVTNWEFRYAVELPASYVKSKQQEEIKELEDNVEEAKLPNSVNKMDLQQKLNRVKSNLATDQPDLKQAIQELTQVVKIALDLPKLELVHLIHYINLKTLCRMETIYFHPHSRRDERREKTLGLEKLLEGLYFHCAQSPFSLKS